MELRDLKHDRETGRNRIKKLKKLRKPDLFKKPEQLRENRKAPKWRTDQKYEEKNERSERFNSGSGSGSGTRFERRTPEPSPSSCD